MCFEIQVSGMLSPFEPGITVGYATVKLHSTNIKGKFVIVYFFTWVWLDGSTAAVSTEHHPRVDSHQHLITLTNNLVLIFLFWLKLFQYQFWKRVILLIIRREMQRRQLQYFQMQICGQVHTKNDNETHLLHSECLFNYCSSLLLIYYPNKTV